ncbi:MAG: CBS domain-containing protein [Spirochaetales bacterium]|jgi:tRNA nucleotidyltransferase (CCA-adding enzyme)|nr:CBS domain-containing protein [Spirochaetales bacterium]
MKIALGHTNMDLDCLGSLIMVKNLFPEYRLVRSRLIHPAAHNLYNLYQYRFNFLDIRDLAGTPVEEVIIVDTANFDRVKEYFANISSAPSVTIYDHHPGENLNIAGASLIRRYYGSNTTILAEMARKQNIILPPDEATIALTGIYADTGRLIYENVRREDYEAAAYLLDCGASLKLVKSFLETLKEDIQLEILHQLLRIGVLKDIQGHAVFFTCLELEENIPGMAAVVEKIMELENPDAYFAVFGIAKTRTVLLIARSQKASIDLHTLLAPYGGGGHQLAASAKITGKAGREFMDGFMEYLESALLPATRAWDIMSREVITLSETMSLREASGRLEAGEHTGAPVLNDRGELSGFLSLRDIMKGRKAGLMQAPVKAFMSSKVISSDGSVSIREVERIFYRNRIGHLPIVRGRELVGMVTRWDYLQFKLKQAGVSKNP